MHQYFGLVESILKRLGYEPSTVADAHLCCGSAGTYSIFQPKLSQQLKINKLKNLQAYFFRIGKINLRILKHIKVINLQFQKNHSYFPLFGFKLKLLIII
jgi:hypothetical protein